MKKVSVILADGFEEIEALTAVDLLRRAQIYVDTVSITEEYTVHGAHGINVQTEDLFEEVNFVESDMIVLPGGMPGTLNLDAHSGVRRVVKDFFEEGKYIGAICAGPTVLANLWPFEGQAYYMPSYCGAGYPGSGHHKGSGNCGQQCYHRTRRRRGSRFCP